MRESRDIVGRLLFFGTSPHRKTDTCSIERAAVDWIRGEMFAGGGGVAGATSGGYGDRDFVSRLAKPPAERDSEVSADFSFFLLILLHNDFS